MSVLEIKHATMRFGGLTAVDDLNLDVNKGEIVGLIGPNGAGKTTVFNFVTGVYAPTSGEVLFHGKKLNGLRPDQIAYLGIARTFQNIRLCKNMSVLDNVLIANHLHLKSNLFECILSLPKARREEAEIREKSHELLSMTGLSNLENEIAGSLPYGLQRRLEIARALATNPTLLLLDEPAAGMNPKETLDLADYIRKIKELFHLDILLIEHHMKFVMGLVDEIYVLEYGKTIAHDVPAEIQRNEAVIQAYLGIKED